MKALLDTNIIIHRENTQATNYSIGLLFYWLDKMHYDKCIHPLTVIELRKLKNSNMQQLYDAKLGAYIELKTIAPQTTDFMSKLTNLPKTQNDVIDNQLLYEVYSGRTDFLITEDRRMRNKAISLGIEDRVFSINSFVSKMTADNPELMNYKMLSVKKEYFGNIDVTDQFFDSFRSLYSKFDNWFAGKCNEKAYICKNDNNDILGFLYLKTENIDENYSDIAPAFAAKKRLKIGTFKVETSGFRLGERFIKIIFDNALERHVDEIYVTIFEGKSELAALENLLSRWGFYKYGKKIRDGKEETVLVKNIGIYDKGQTPKENFPNIIYNHQKFLVPIIPKFHTTLLPDSKLNTENEIDFLGQYPHRYALQKVYISFSFERNIFPGDIILFYRPGEHEGRKGYESVITTVGIVDEVQYNFSTKDDFFKHCQNRSVFANNELDSFWTKNQARLLVLKFIYVRSLKKKLNLSYLWDQEIVPYPNGPRPFTKITDQQFDMILSDSETILRFCEEK